MLIAIDDDCDYAVMYLAMMMTMMMMMTKFTAVGEEGATLLSTLEP